MDASRENGSELKLSELFKRLRKEARLSQEALAEQLGVSPAFIGMIESGRRRPSPYTLRQFARVLNLSTQQQDQLTTVAEQRVSQLSAVKKASLDFPREDWGEAPDVANFYGREQEQGDLKRWIVDDGCRLAAILGIGGIGKTSLAAIVTQQIKDKFEYIFWRSLQNAPPLESLLKAVIQFLFHQQQFELLVEADNQILRLIQHLREHRCLIVLDNLETILQAGNRAGQYREGYEGYGKFLQLVGETRHQSCLLLTSREKPKEVAFIEGDTSLVRSFQLRGLRSIDGQEILKDKGLRGAEKIKESLIYRYAGNPLALKLVSQFIRDVFDGDIVSFLETAEAIFSDIRDVFGQQFDRLSALEREIMYWLAIEREATSFDELHEDLAHPVSKRELLETLESLRRRSLIEISSAAHFTQQPVIMEYAIDELIGQISMEIDSGSIELLASHSLIKAQTKDYVRESQVHLILAPVAERLLAGFGKEGSKKKLKSILTTLRETSPQSGYAAGNVLNLLIQLQCDLRGYDFSHLTVWQANLQHVTLPDVNFTYANLSKCIFTETFGGVISVAFSPNGELLAAGTATDEIRSWHARSGTPLLTYHGHSDWVFSVSFSPDSTTLASGSQDQTVRLWDVHTGQLLKTFQGHTNRVRSVIFSQDGTILASGSEDWTIRLWDVYTGQLLKTLQGHTNCVRSVTFSPDGTTLASGSDDKTIRLWNAHTGQPLITLQGHESRVRSVTFSPDGTTLASGSDDKTIRLWNGRTGELLIVLSGHTSWVWSTAYSPDGATLASGSEDQTIRLWNAHTGQPLMTLRGQGGRGRSVAFNSEGTILASGNEEQAVRLWDTHTGQLLKSLQGYTNRIWSVAFSPSGSILGTSSEDYRIRLWEVNTGQCLRTLQGHTGQIWSVAFSPDGRILASGSDDQSVRLWDIGGGQCLKVLHGHTHRVSSIAFSPGDGNVFATGSYDQTVRLWNTSTGQLLVTLQGHTNRVWSVTFSPDGNLLASGSEDGTVRLWDVSTRRGLKVLQGHTNRVWSVAFNPDGSLLASGGDDQTVRLWDVSTKQCLKILKGHSSWIRSVAFSPDGKSLASGSHDQTVRLWDTSTGKCLKVLQEHTGQIWSVAFNPNGRILASGSNDGTIKFWNIQTGECQRTIKSDRPYERMNITGVSGLTEAQKAMLRALGAIEDEMGGLS